MSTIDKKIEYGTVELPDDEFEPKNVKIRVTMMVDQDVLDAFRKTADKRGIGYQTLMNEKLREAVENLDLTFKERITAVVKEVLRETATRDYAITYRGLRQAFKNERPMALGRSRRATRAVPAKAERVMLKRKS